MSATQAMEHVGETSGMANHDHDLIHELSKRLDGLWRYDQFIASAEGHSEIQQFWQDLKAQEQENVEGLKSLVAKEIERGCF
jgi:hypothetical protein